MMRSFRLRSGLTAVAVAAAVALVVVVVAVVLLLPLADKIAPGFSDSLRPVPVDGPDLARYFGLGSVPGQLRVWRAPDYLRAFGGGGGKREDGGGRRKIVCWISTFPDRMELAKTALFAWGRHCRSFYIMSSANSSTGAAGAAFEETSVSGASGARVVSLDAASDYKSLWRRTQMAMEFIRRKEREEDFDYILKGDDDTFVFMANLRKFLRPFDPDDKLYIGHPQRGTGLGTYMSGCGYVLSRAAFSAAMTGFPELSDVATGHNGGGSGSDSGDVYAARRRRLLRGNRPEDSAVGTLMAAVNVTFVGSEDEEGRPLFFPLSPSALLDSDDVPTWFPRLRDAVFYVDVDVGGDEGGSTVEAGEEEPKFGLRSPETAFVATVHYVKKAAMEILGERTVSPVGEAVAVPATALQEVKDISRQGAKNLIKKKRRW